METLLWQLQVLNVLNKFIAYATITIIFNQNPDKYVGFCGIAYCVGYLSGPTLGAVIYTLTDYTQTFVLFGILVIFGAFAMIFIIP